jgi:DNA-binding transcriptional LysR family regulator
MDRARHLHGPALRYFAAVARSGSIRSAARELNVASSAVNRQILWLEQMLGHELFDRLARGVRLTPAGEVLRAHVQRTLSDFEATVGDLDALTGMQRGSVHVTTVESLAETLVPSVISAFRQRFPGIHLHVRLTGAEGVARALFAGETDVGFSFEPPNDPRISTAFHRDLAIGAIMRPDHPLAGRAGLILADCLRHRFCLPSRGLSLRKRIDAALGERDLVGEAFVETNSLRLMKSLALDDGTIAFQTVLGLEGELAAGTLVFRPLADVDLRRNRFGILTSSHRGLGHAAKAFFDHAVSAIGERLSQSDADPAS